MTGKVLFLDHPNNTETALALLKALSSETRLAILAYLGDRSVNVNDIALALQIAPSSATTHIQILEKADLIRTEVIPASRGLQKLCARTYDDVHIRLERILDNSQNSFRVSMPVGQYFDFDVKPTCGLASETRLIGLLDTPASFYEPDRISAQLLWFGAGFVSYRFPNYLPQGAQPTRLDFSAEICSENLLSRYALALSLMLRISEVSIFSANISATIPNLSC